MVVVDDGSVAACAGILPGDEILSIDGTSPRDILEYQQLVDEADISISVRRRGVDVDLRVTKVDGEPLGVEIQSPVFDRVRTCDNHCSFCFIYQLPKGMRRSLYVKDDDYRLSFLYGNFTTLTRFTEADLERVITEGLSPLYVSIHSTNPAVRARMLANRRGATSLRWLEALLANGITVHGQVVVCPGINSGSSLEDTLMGVLDKYPKLESLSLVPLGTSDHAHHPDLRNHTPHEAAEVVEAVDRWQSIYMAALGRRLVYASDEYYLIAQRDFPTAETYGDFPMFEDGVGMARSFETEFRYGNAPSRTVSSGFFASVDGAPPTGYRSNRTSTPDEASGMAATARAESAHLEVVPRRPQPSESSNPQRMAPVIVTGEYGERVLRPLLASENIDAEILAVPNRFFGGNVAVAGLLVGQDIAQALATASPGRRYLLPDICLTEGRFLDDTTPSMLPLPVEVIPANGRALREALIA